MKIPFIVKSNRIFISILSVSLLIHFILIFLWKDSEISKEEKRIEVELIVSKTPPRVVVPITQKKKIKRKIPLPENPVKKTTSKPKKAIVRAKPKKVVLKQALAKSNTIVKAPISSSLVSDRNLLSKNTESGFNSVFSIEESKEPFFKTELPTTPNNQIKPLSAEFNQARPLLDKDGEKNLANDFANLNSIPEISREQLKLKSTVAVKNTKSGKLTSLSRGIKRKITAGKRSAVGTDSFNGNIPLAANSDLNEKGHLRRRALNQNVVIDNGREDAENINEDLDNSSINLQIGNRKLLKRPPVPSLNVEKQIKISFRFTVKPNGEVDQIFPLVKGFPELERIAMNNLRKYRFVPLKNSNLTQKGVIHFQLKRKK